MTADPAPSPSPPVPVEAGPEDAAGAGTFASGAPGAALLAGGLALAAALFLAPGAARADDECGAAFGHAGHVIICTNADHSRRHRLQQPGAQRRAHASTAVTAPTTSVITTGIGRHAGQRRLSQHLRLRKQRLQSSPSRSAPRARPTSVKGTTTQANGTRTTTAAS